MITLKVENNNSKQKLIVNLHSARLTYKTSNINTVKKLRFKNKT